MYGVTKRWSKFSQGKKKVIIPLDHGLNLGPISGIDTVDAISALLSACSFDGVIAHKGIIEKLIMKGQTKESYIMQLSGMYSKSTVPDQKIILSTVDYAVCIGADAISLQCNFDGYTDKDNMINLGNTCEAAHKLGMPVLAMIYPAKGNENNLSDYIRMCIELGASGVKIPILEENNLMHSCLNKSKDIDVFLSGGEATPELDEYISKLLPFVDKITGISVGRNIFQRPAPAESLSAIKESINA